MARDIELKKARANYVKKVVNESPKTGDAIKKLSKKLFVSQRTIWRDLTTEY